MVAGSEATRHNLIASSSLRHIWQETPAFFGVRHLFIYKYINLWSLSFKVVSQSILVLACDQVSSLNKLNFCLRTVCWHKMSLTVLFIFLCFEIVSHLDPFYQDQALMYLTYTAFAWAGSSSRVCSSHSYSSNQPFVHQTSPFFTKITQINANPLTKESFFGQFDTQIAQIISISSS